MAYSVTEYFNEYNCILRLINSTINNKSCDISDISIDWEIIYKIAVDLSFTALVKAGITKLPQNQQPKSEIKKFFERDFARQLIIDTNQMYELKKIENTFENNNIDMLLLKGYYMKNIYSQSIYRYMGDIDTYVKKEDFSKADEVLSSLEYTAETLGGHDKIFKKEPFICLEQHFLLYDGKSEEIKKYYQTIFEKCTLKNGYSHIYLMKPEDIYIYMVVHTVHHLYYAGIAPRIFLDFYVFLEKYKNNIDMDYINKILNDFKYKDFNKVCIQLAYKWFSPNGNGLEKNNKIDNFVLSGSTYGTMEHNFGIRTAKMTADGKSASKLKFLFSQLFPKYSLIRSEFQILNKAPFLLPFVWIAYVAKKIGTSKTLKYYSSINDDTANFYKEILKDFGVQNIED